MSTKRALLVVLVASGVMLAVGVGPRLAGNAYALPPVQEPDPTGVTIPYPGRLAGDAGQPVADGAYDFTFALYDAKVGGEPLWSEAQEGVAVQEGAFNALLGSADAIPMEALEGGERWLEVGVRGPGESDFTALTPRQRLSVAAPASPASPAAPSNGMTCPHDHWGEAWSGNGIGLRLNSNDSHSLQITGAGEHGIDIVSAGRSGVNVYSAGHDGVRVRSANWSGVYVGSSGSDAIRVQTAGQDGLRFFEGIGRDYIRAGSDADLDFRVTNNGTAYADGGWQGAADFAELMTTEGDTAAYEPGDVLVISAKSDRSVALSSAPYSTMVIGIYSEEPGFVGSSHAMEGQRDDEIPVAVVGIVPCKVSAESGPIRRGDLLVTSSTPGHAMRADNPSPGTILGKALESLDAGTGTILVLVTLQ